MDSNAETDKKKHTASVEMPSPRLVCLEIDQITLYDRNPRTTRNPEFERIKRSIMDRGLEQPLIVTRRPGEQKYLVKAGGNTRLQILKELYAASADPSYAMVTCIEVGWQDESDVLVGHLRENSLRGNLTFIDKAAAVCAFAEILAEERGGSTPTIRDLQSALLDQGYPISATLLSYMRYAADFLMPLIPVALSDGLGWHAIRNIRKLQRTGNQLWSRYSIGSESEYNDTFAELCRRLDGPDWQFEVLLRSLANEISEAADISVQTARMAIDARLSGSAEPENGDKISRPAGDNARQGQRHADAKADERAPENKNPQSKTLTVVVDIGDESCGDERRTSRRHDVVQQGPLLDLRRRAYGLADSLVRRLRMDNLVVPLPDCGHGFLIADVPDASLLKSVDAHSRATLGTMWWQLLAFSETVCAPPEVIDERLPASSSLRSILQDQKLELLFDRVEIIEAAYFAERFWANLPKQDWQDWLYLAHTHREIRSKVIELEQPLWSVAQ